MPSPDEVTPPMAGSHWGPERIEWLRRLHRDRRLGLDGPLGEATWAVALDGEVVGGVRLKRMAEPDVLETGIWLTRSARGKGVGRKAIADVLDWRRSTVRGRCGRTRVRRTPRRSTSSSGWASGPPGRATGWSPSGRWPRRPRSGSQARTSWIVTSQYAQSCAPGPKSAVMARPALRARSAKARLSSISMSSVPQQR